MKSEYAQSRKGFARFAENLTLLKIAKLLIGAVSISNLILSQIHVAGLLMLENELCGFVMFFTVLFGLVCLFQSTRIKKNNIREFIPLAVFFVLTVFLLAILASIYINAINYQVSLIDPSNVINALTLTLTLVVLYILSFILFLIDYLRNGRIHNGEKVNED